MLTTALHHRSIFGRCPIQRSSDSPVGTTGDDAATEGLPVVRRLPFAPEGLEAYPKPNNRVKFVEGRAALSKTPALGYFNDLECFNPHWFLCEGRMQVVERRQVTVGL